LVAEDFDGLGEADVVRVKVRPTGNDADYPKPFDIEIPVRWWMSQTYVRTKSWRIEGAYNSPYPTQKLAGFIRNAR
jgi:hypothetical protein